VRASSPALVLASLTLTSPRVSSWRTSIRNDFSPLTAVQSADLAAPPDLTLNPPHSLASDAWKGLVFSLMAANRNAEALGELNRIPADSRRLLEADVEWVQAIASLYVAVGDAPHADAYVHRVETFYLLHRAALPAPLEIQHAWLLYNLHSDATLYPVLTALDARTDLTADQRQQLQILWANWAIRRANQDLAAGQPLHAVQILEAAAQSFPASLDIRFALAGAYARIGRSQDALALFKSIPMNQAASGDFQGAIWSAISARDMAQAEIWLRAALDRFPSDPNVLALAARFEQARGNKQRATEFWRAAIAATPPGSSITNPGDNSSYPSSPASNPGDIKRLLNPSLDPGLNAEPTPDQLAPLPSYKSLSPQAALPPLPSATETATAPSNNPLPLPFTGRDESAEQGTQPPTPPVFVAPRDARNTSSSAAQLPPSEKNVNSAGQSDADVETGITASTQPSSNASAPAPTSPPDNLRISSEPMNVLAAQAQARFAAQTDSQPAQGPAALIHTIPNAVSPASSPTATPVQATAPTAPAAAFAPPNPTPAQENAPTPAIPAATPNRSAHTDHGVYNVAQNTPSAQDAASGAYSAPQQKQQPTAPAASSSCQTTVPACPPSKPAPTIAPKHKRRKPATQPAQPTQTLGNAPISATPENAPPSIAPAESQTQPESTTSSGVSDEELQQQNLPPLRGPWIRIQRQAAPPSPRDLAEQQLQAIESGYSGWLGGTSLLNYRSGAPGYSQLAAIESPFEASAPLGVHARITAIARPVFLDSGQADGTATTSVLESQSGATCLVAIPEPIGTYTAGQNFTPCTSPSINALIPPAQQNAFGLGGELQLTFPHLTIAGGSTPFDFLVSTVTGRFQWNPNGGPVTISLVRDSEKDSQLSYAGLRDPAGNTLSTQGQIWGGVVANQGTVQVAHGDAESGFYFAGSGQYLTGYNTRSNSRVDGTGGAYWRVMASPEFGNLTLGANFFGMHYANNQNAFTHGMGGYFSPQAYFLANVPLNWQGHYGTRWHYNISGALGVQAFQEDSTPLWPLAGDKPLEVSQNNPMLPNVTSVSPNYDFHSQVAYQIHTHWFTGAYFAANNTRNYSYASVGFFVRYTFREQPSAVAAPTGLFPADGPRPFTVP
jgi:cellulose synthase operon protein C